MIRSYGGRVVGDDTIVVVVVIMSTVDSMTSFNLSNGMSIPSVGFGTYKVGYTPTGERIGRDGKDVIIDAIKAGYR